MSCHEPVNIKKNEIETFSLLKIHHSAASNYYTIQLEITANSRHWKAAMDQADGAPHQQEVSGPALLQRTRVVIISCAYKPTTANVLNDEPHDLPHSRGGIEDGSNILQVQEEAQ